MAEVSRSTAGLDAGSQVSSAVAPTPCCNSQQHVRLLPADEVIAEGHKASCSFSPHAMEASVVGRTTAGPAPLTHLLPLPAATSRSDSGHRRLHQRGRQHSRGPERTSGVVWHPHECCRERQFTVPLPCKHHCSQHRRQLPPVVNRFQYGAMHSLTCDDGGRLSGGHHGDIP